MSIENLLTHVRRKTSSLLALTTLASMFSGAEAADTLRGTLYVPLSLKDATACYDRNNDGVLTMDEWAQGMAWSVDTHNSMVMIIVMRQLEAGFRKEYDPNNDGIISPEENPGKMIIYVPAVISYNDISDKIIKYVDTLEKSGRKDTVRVGNRDYEIGINYPMIGGRRELVITCKDDSAGSGPSAKTYLKIQLKDDGVEIFEDWGYDLSFDHILEEAKRKGKNLITYVAERRELISSIIDAGLKKQGT